MTPGETRPGTGAGAGPGPDPARRPTAAAPRRRPFLRLALVLAAVGALAGGGIAWWLETGRHLFHPKNFGVVEEGKVYRCGQAHRRLIEDLLRDRGIRVVIDLSADPEDDEDAAAEREVVRRLGIRKVDLVNLGGRGTGDPADYVVALREIFAAKDAGLPVLVHCSGGSERTGAAVAMYRMLGQGWDGVRAWEEYLSYRRDPPETDVLVRYVNENLPMIAARLEADGTIPRVPDPLPVFGPAPGRTAP